MPVLRENMINQVITLNLIPNSIQPVIHVSQYDEGQTWIFKLMVNQDDFVIPENATVKLQGTNSDGTTFNILSSFSGNTVTVNVTNDITACAGKTNAKIRIKENNDVISTQKFIIQVEKKP